MEKVRGKLFFGSARTIAAIFRGDFARHFRAKKMPREIC
jgi:hypothetical protein